jgi:hypothetical protein
VFLLLQEILEAFGNSFSWHIDEFWDVPGRPSRPLHGASPPNNLIICVSFEVAVDADTF